MVIAVGANSVLLRSDGEIVFLGFFNLHNQLSIPKLDSSLSYRQVAVALEDGSVKFVAVLKENDYFGEA